MSHTYRHRFAHQVAVKPCSLADAVAQAAKGLVLAVTPAEYSEVLKAYEQAQGRYLREGNYTVKAILRK